MDDINESIFEFEKHYAYLREEDPQFAPVEFDINEFNPKKNTSRKRKKSEKRHLEPTNKKKPT